MNHAGAFFSSPLSRRPSLLLRKALSRLGLRKKIFHWPALPANLHYAPPPHYLASLRAWLREISWHPGPHPFNHVFDTMFDESVLLEQSRSGPTDPNQGLLSDVKLGWEYSRAHPLVTNAAADRSTLEHCAAFLRRWIAANPGPTQSSWSCAMDVAIRATNWIMADALFDGTLGRNLGGPWPSMLWKHGWMIWEHLEARLVSSNHYLADLLGLYLIGSVFPEDPRAQSWRAFAAREFPAALLAQTHADGGLNEASLRYHALVTEMALLFRLARKTPLPAPAEARLLQMCQIVADFQDSSGDVFPVGDDDSGRILGIDTASNHGRCAVLLGLASLLFGRPFQTRTHALYSESGWWIRRNPLLTLMVEFGGVGLHGVGAHAHNDDLSFCLEWRSQPLIVDPGTFLYTSDQAARDRFRSTAFHNTVLVNGSEQRPLGSDPFLLPGTDQAASTVPVDHDGIALRRDFPNGSLHPRCFTPASDHLTIRDRVEGTGSGTVEWNFHLAPNLECHTTSDGFRIRVNNGRVVALTTNRALEFRVLPTEVSPGYGRKAVSLKCSARYEGVFPCEVTWQFIDS